MEISMLTNMLATLIALFLSPAAAVGQIPKVVNTQEGGESHFYDRGHNALTGGRTALALEAFLQSCKGGNTKSCFNDGLMRIRSRGVGADVPLGFDYYQIACRRGSADACTNLAYEYAQSS